MPNQPLLASRTLTAVDRGGVEKTITIGVGVPYEITPTEWACPVQLNGLHDGLRDIHGADSWQSLQLAYQLIVQLLVYFERDGGALYWPISRDRIAAQELIPRSPK